VRSASLALESAHAKRTLKGPGHRAALVETSAVLNAALVAYALRPELESRSCRVVFGCYDLATRFVHVPREARGPASAGIGLFPPPRNDREFRRLATDLARCAGVRSLLAG
jgi:carbonic anhydrase